jgi:hypothetical protein
MDNGNVLIVIDVMRISIFGVEAMYISGNSVFLPDQQLDF